MGAILSFIVEMTKALAWPLAIVAVAALFRKTLPNLIERLTKLKYGDFEAAFTDQAVHVAESISETSPQPVDFSPIKNDKLLALAQQSPRAAVVESWVNIERKLNELAQMRGLMGGTKRPYIPDLIRALRMDKTITPESENALFGLLQLRNLAAHAPGEELSVQKAVDFVTLANALLWTLSTPASRE